MVEVIKSIKDALLEQVEQDLQEKGPNRIDPKMIDQIKDLAEAEKSCWEAEYYMTVTEAMGEGSMGYEEMESMGYAQGGQGGGGGNQGGSGYREGQGYRRGYRRGYRGQPRDSQGRYASRRGYRYGHGDMMQDIKAMMQEADPQEREKLKRQLRQMTEQM